LIALSALLSVGIGAYVTTHPVSAQPTGPASIGDRAQQASTTMKVTLDEFTIKPEMQQVPAGDVTFDVQNSGEDVHELIVFKSDLDEKSLPPGAKDEVDENAVGEYIGGFEDVQSGDSANGTLVLAPGRYILLCNIAKHYGNGMVTTLQVN
jgi:uncharacterized cupredoxin-like copper-binding protein